MINYKNILTTLLFGLLGIHTALGSNALDTARATVKEWVATENAISAEAIAWDEKQNLLNDLIAVTRAEKNQLLASIEEIESTATAADSIRTELVHTQESLSKSQQLLNKFLKHMEPKLIGLKTSLPQPLIKKLEPFYQRIPEKPEITSLNTAERMQTVVSLLTAIQQFDQNITVTEELRELNDGSTGEVITLYLGLGSAYYKTRSGDDAGVGTPNANGWIWNAQPQLSERIAEAIAIAQNVSQEARFIQLPIQIQN